MWSGSPAWTLLWGRILGLIVCAVGIPILTHLFAGTTEEGEQRAGLIAMGWFLTVALVLLLGGAIGNLIDRAISGEVIDFVHLYWRGVFDWATFNVADVLITAGLAFIVADMFLPRRAAPSEPQPSEPAPPEPSTPTETTP